MNTKRLIINEIDRLTRVLEKFENRSLTSGFYHLLKDKYEDSLITVCKQDKYANSESSLVFKGYKNVGIVFQGPVMKENNFTLETIKMLRNWYPDITIILSTWENELTDDNRYELKKLNCFFIESKQMNEENKGPNEKIGHLNNQILSSKLGMDYLTECGIEYAMKIRSDLRIYKKDFVPYLLNLLKVYDRADYQLINVAFSNSMYNVPFHLSDFIWFGRMEEMREMYSIKYRDDNDLHKIVEFVKSDEFLKYKKTFADIRTNKFTLDSYWYNAIELPIDFMTLYHEEIYLPYNYWLLKKNENYCNFLSEYYEFLTHVIVVDDQDLSVYWSKNLYSVVQHNYSKMLDERLTHSKWLEIYLNLRNKNEV